MSDTDILTLLKQSLGEPNANSDRVNFLNAKIRTAKEFLIDNGIVFTYDASNNVSTKDGDLIVMYAEFLVQKRDTQEGIPRHLEWAIHNRLIQQRTEENV